MVAEVTQRSKLAALEVCDVIIYHISEQFKFTDHLEASALFFATNFPDYSLNFPQEKFEITVKLFPLLQIERLHTELKILYSRMELRTSTGAIPLLKYMLKNNMQNVFCEVIKLLRIVCTMPMTSAEAERCFSTLKRIKDFLRNIMQEERLTALAMLSSKKYMINRMKDFNERVIETFVSQKERRMDFIYKNI